MERRGFLRAILAAGLAPTVVKADIIMPVKKIIAPNIPARGQTQSFVVLDEYPFYPPALEIKYSTVITEDDLLDDKYSKAVHELMLAEDKQLGALMTQELERMSQRGGFMRKFLARPSEGMTVIRTPIKRYA